MNNEENLILIKKIFRIKSFLYDNKLVRAYSDICALETKISRELSNEGMVDLYRKFIIPIKTDIEEGHTIFAWKRCETLLDYIGFKKEEI